MSRFSIFLRIDNGTWSRVQAETLPRRALTVVAAFTLAAWNRFGAQAVLGLRSPVRMILIGVYGWIALTLVIWFIAQRREFSVPGTPLYSLQRAATSLTVAHFPLIILGMYIATFGVWMPVLLARAMQHLTDIGRSEALALIAIPYLLWLALVGRHLHDQVGHLL